jgi:hypothetical protein
MDLKVHLHEIFDLSFFSSIDPIWDPVSGSKKFSNLNVNSPRYSNSKGIRRSIRIRGKKFFFMLGHYKKLFLFGFRSKSSPSLHFLKYCPFKSCEEKKFYSEYSKFFGAVSKYAE